MALIEGTVAPGWEPVRAAFEDNFTEHGDLGAGVAVFHRGQPVVDLVGGYRDRERSVPYGHDALQLVFSTTKGVASACVALCVERGWLDPAAPVHPSVPLRLRLGRRRDTFRPARPSLGADPCFGAEPAVGFP